MIYRFFEGEVEPSPFLVRFSPRAGIGTVTGIVWILDVDDPEFPPVDED
jgi:hypothetical protein